LPAPEKARELFSSDVFDLILLREPWRGGFRGSRAARDPEAEFADLAESAKALLSPRGRLVLLCSPPVTGQRISRFVADEDKTLAALVESAEDAFFSKQGKTGPWNWDAACLSDAFASRGFKIDTAVLEQREERLVGPKDINAWFDKKNSRWGVFMGKNLDESAFARTEEILTRRIRAGPLPWKWKSLLLTIENRE